MTLKRLALFSLPLTLVIMRLLSAQMAASVANPEQFAAWRTQIRKALYIPDPLPALNTVNFGKFSPAADVIGERLSYATQFDMRVPAILYVPREHVKKRMPALIVVNGHGGDKYSWYAFYTGILYARAGAVVLTYDPIGEGERNRQRESGTRAHDLVIAGPHMGARMGGEMVTDVMQAVSYLSHRPDVDPTRIAVVGYSMGSFISALAGAIDQRIHALVLSGGGDLDGEGGYWDSSRPMCQGRPYQALSFLGDRAAIIFALNQRRGPTFIVNGTADTVVDIPHHLEPFFQDLRSRVHRITETQANIFDTYFISGAGHRPNWVARPTARWLVKQLNISSLTEKQLNSLPESHISEWAAKNNVHIDRDSLKEDREGGIMALRDDVPNVQRADLNVFTDQQWQQHRLSLIYEVWVEKAHAADESLALLPKIERYEQQPISMPRLAQR